VRPFSSAGSGARAGLQRLVLAASATVALMLGLTAGTVLTSGIQPAAAATRTVRTCATIGQGSTGHAVRQIQKLVGAGVDGQFGPQTAKAVRHWQKANGVAVTGVVDAATWAALPSATALAACAATVGGSGVSVGCATLSQGSSGLAVAVLQTALKTTVDGQFGSDTKAALAHAQAAAELSATGVTSRATWQALGLAKTPVCTRRSSVPARPKDWKQQQRVRARADRLAATLDGQPGTTSNKVALAALAFAKKQIGKPYQWGGVGPKSYDCSGLQMASYLHAGITIPRVAADQYAGSGPTVPLDQAQQGDLLFYAGDVTKPSTIFHVVMYVGAGKVLDAPQTGEDVQVQSLWTTDLLPVAVRPVAALTLPVSSGASGWTVTQLQQALNRHGAKLTVDGGFGPSTMTAVKSWQAKHKLKASGVVRLGTWLTLG
jgi:peptidoglycan hydrolase-like protein with peptidoglycan-binding domain